ncbi:class I glutamine amidotransferase-like protein [Fistulina hepatica ATCC 64428]|nr:class I glutamine amidotransferase-like protein [Fistulina hepatica ATCC 64428]
MTVVNIALMVTDTPSQPIRETHGDYHNIFSTWMKASAPDPKIAEPRLTAFDVVQAMEYPTDEALDTYKAIIITGSAASAYEPLEWIEKLVAWVAHVATVKPHIKLVGVCFGHQIIGRALGGSCVPNGQWEIGPTSVELTDLGKQLFSTDCLSIQEMHRDHVPQVLPGFEPLGSTNTCPNQGMVRFSSSSIPLHAPVPRTLSDVHILTVQGHPEFTRPIVDKLVELRSAKGTFDASLTGDYAQRKENAHNGIDVLGKTVWRILGYEA